MASVTSKLARFRAAKLAAIVGAGTLVAGCAENAPQDIFRPAGENADDIDGLTRLIMYIALVVGIIVAITVTVVIIRFRDRGQPIPEQTHGKPALEIAPVSYTHLTLPTTSP